jgi:hypothetical protein
VSFQPHDPSAEELAEQTMSMEDDLFEPFWSRTAWERGKKQG